MPITKNVFGKTRMRANLLVAFFLMFFSFSVFPVKFARTARGAQELVPAGHWVYDAITAISLESGIVNFADCAPLSIQEIKIYLAEIDYDSLSEAGQSQYDRIFDYFNERTFAFESGLLSLGLEPSLNLSGFYKTNDDIGWLYDRYERKPALDVPVTFSVGDYLTMSMDNFLGENKGASLKNDVYSNVPLDANDIDINFPDTGYFSTGYMFTDTTGIGFQLGRGSQSIGRTLSGSMIWSEYLTGVSYGQFEFYAPSLKYTGRVSQFNVDKYMYTHQIDVRLFKKLKVSFVEGLLVYAPMELRYMNPWTIFHGFAAWREYEPEERDPESHTCDYFGVSMQFTPFKTTRFYGLFAMTQYQTPYEKSNWKEDVTPNGLGAQGGMESYIPAGKGYFHFAFEGSWAQPYLYIKESPNWSMVRTYSENMGKKSIFYEWIGSPFGPDTVSGEVTAGYEKPGKYSLDLTYLFMARGEFSGNSVFDAMKHSDGRNLWGGQRTYFDVSEVDPNNTYLSQWAYPNTSYNDGKKLQNLTSPSGRPEFVSRWSLRGTIQPANWLKITAQPGYVYIYNSDHVHRKVEKGFEIALAIEIAFTKF